MATSQGPQFLYLLETTHPTATVTDRCGRMPPVVLSMQAVGWEVLLLPLMCIPVTLSDQHCDQFFKSQFNQYASVAAQYPLQWISNSPYCLLPIY